MEDEVSGLYFPLVAMSRMRPRPAKGNVIEPHWIRIGEGRLNVNDPHWRLPKHGILFENGNDAEIAMKVVNCTTGTIVLSWQMHLNFLLWP